MSLVSYLRRHKKNDDRPYMLGGAVAVIVGLIFGLLAFVSYDRYLLQTGSLAAVISSVLTELANTDRSQQSIQGLTVSPVLTAAAQAKANDMAAKGYFAHVSPDGHNSWYWFKLVNYQFSYAGENLAVDFSDSNAVETAWMNSPAHRANILDADFKEIGIATAQGFYQGHPTTFVVEMFGTPAEVPVAVVEATIPTSPTQPALAVATTKKHVKKIATTSPAIAKENTSSTTNAVLGASVAQPPQIQPSPKSPGALAYLLASPELTLDYSYWLIAIVIVGLLALVTGFEWKHHHMHHVRAAILLLLLMFTIFTIAGVTMFAPPTLAAPAATLTP